jgi:hypothetical protein
VIISERLPVPTDQQIAAIATRLAMPQDMCDCKECRARLVGLVLDALRQPTMPLATNTRGDWVPAIPRPEYRGFRVRCDCGRSFWTRPGYEGHYALIHILDGRP